MGDSGPIGSLRETGEERFMEIDSGHCAPGRDGQRHRRGSGATSDVENPRLFRQLAHQSQEERERLLRPRSLPGKPGVDVHELVELIIGHTETL
jgi:hypothetical protein